MKIHETADEGLLPVALSAKELRELDACFESLAEELREFNVQGLVAIGQRLAHGRPAVCVDVARDLPALRARVDSAVARCPRDVPIEVREVDAERLEDFEI